MAVRVLAVMLVRVGMSLPMMVVLVRIVVRVVMLLVRVNIELHPFDLRPFLARGVQVATRELQFLQLLFERLKIDPQIDHRAEEHVPANAAEDVQVDRFHFRSPDASALIWLAAYPAPKPLLMFTTVVPLPQLLSIASSAV